MRHFLRSAGYLRAATETLTLELAGMGSCAVQVSGTWVGTLVFEVSLTKDTWTTLSMAPPNSTTTVTGATANGLWSASVAGMHAIRVRCSVFTSGEIGVDLLASPSAASGGGGSGGGGGGDGAILDGVVSSIKSTVRNYAGGKPLCVEVVDTAGNAVTISGAPSASTSALTNVTASAASGTVLAANALRLAFQLYNDADKPVDVKCGATASATSFTKRMLPNEIWGTKELGVNYTGKLDAIWDSGPTGSMRVTELSA